MVRMATRKRNPISLIYLRLGAGLHRLHPLLRLAIAIGLTIFAFGAILLLGPALFACDYRRT